MRILMDGLHLTLLLDAFFVSSFSSGSPCCASSLLLFFLHLSFSSPLHYFLYYFSIKFYPTSCRSSFQKPSCLVHWPFNSLLRSSFVSFVVFSQYSMSGPKFSSPQGGVVNSLSLHVCKFSKSVSLVTLPMQPTDDSKLESRG